MSGIGILGRAMALAAVFSINSSWAQAGGYAVTARGPDYRVWQKTTLEQGTNRVHRYVELATGMNYTNSYGQLVEAQEQISVLPNGGAAATQGRHQVYFPTDIHDGVLEVVTPDGKHLKSRPVGVSYDDGSNTVFIATLTNSIGELVNSNQVIYPNAFSGLKADLVCTYRRNGFECDVVFRQQPPTPDQFGLNNTNSTLQMVTEFFNPPEPQQVPAHANKRFGLQDSTLNFGGLTMTQGKAFATAATNSLPPAARSSVSVYKRWLHVQGRTFLIEEVPLTDLAADLGALPLTAKNEKMESGGWQLAKSKISSPYLLSSSSSRQFPPSHPISESTNQMQLARNDLKPEAGVVLDYYATINTDHSSYTFASGQTYYIDGWVNLSGTTVFQGGAVLKYSETAGASLNLNLFTNEASADQPTVFTSANDDSVGEIIAGSSGTPGGVASGFIFGSCAGNSYYRHMRFYYGGWSDPEWESTGNGAIYDEYFKADDVQFINCEYAIDCNAGSSNPSVPDAMLDNVLFANCGLCIGPDSGGFQGSCVVYGNNVTIANSAVGGFDSSYPANASYFVFTNSIFSQTLYFLPEMNGSHNGFYNDSSGGAFGSNAVASTSNPYISAAAAHYYLAAAHAFHNAGTTNIDAGLLAEIQTLTTYAPQAGGWPDTNTPDLGYHYSTNEDSDYDGIPDWWIWNYFGNYNENGTNLDAGGVNTLAYDYANTLDPNVIQFTIGVANNYVTNSIPTLALNVIGGVPDYYAVVVDDTNYVADASWSTYTSSNVTASLGSLQGWHELWVGLKGLPAAATQTWQWKRLKLDTTPPVLVITNPTASTVTVPLLQLQGYSVEALAHISYDLTNALGLVTNQQVLITDQAYSTNTAEFTTNYFHGYDVPLTNGVNTLTLHAVDLAGNMTTLVTNLTLTYSNKPVPVVQFIWPTNGMVVCGSSFIWHGWVSDPTATVTAQTIAGGVTNTFNGALGRDGKFYVQNLPLGSGTNNFTLTVADVAGNVTSTNLTVIQGGAGLRIDAITPNQTTVTGEINANTYTVWVNGVQATLSASVNGAGVYTWEADDVPIPPNNSLVQVQAVPGGGL